MEAVLLLHSDPSPSSGLKDVPSLRRVAQNTDIVILWRIGSKEDSEIVTGEVMELHYLWQFSRESIWKFCWEDQIWRSLSFYDSRTL